MSAYDLVVFDEAHKLAAVTENHRIRKTRRYELAEALAGGGVPADRDVSESRGASVGRGVSSDRRAPADSTTPADRFAGLGWSARHLLHAAGAASTASTGRTSSTSTVPRTTLPIPPASVTPTSATPAPVAPAPVTPAPTPASGTRATKTRCGDRRYRRGAAAGDRYARRLDHACAPARRVGPRIEVREAARGARRPAPRGSARGPADGKPAPWFRKPRGHGGGKAMRRRKSVRECAAHQWSSSVMVFALSEPSGVWHISRCRRPPVA